MSLVFNSISKEGVRHGKRRYPAHTRSVARRLVRDRLLEDATENSFPRTPLIYLATPCGHFPGLLLHMTPTLSRGTDFPWWIEMAPPSTFLKCNSMITGPDVFHHELDKPCFERRPRAHFARWGLTHWRIFEMLLAPLMEKLKRTESKTHQWL